MSKVSIFDIHSHIQFPAYDTDRAEVIKRAQDKNVKMLAVGTQASTSESAIRLAHEYAEDIWATVGHHPSHVVGRSDRSVGATDGWFHDKKEQSETIPEKFDIDKLRILAQDPKVVAIGECGLDYYRLATSDERLAISIKDKQREVFLQQAQLAQELNKALMIHCRPAKGSDDAYHDLLSIIPNSKFLIPKIVHFYVGGLEITKKLFEKGFYFTFGGVITFARDYDEVIKYIPLDRILLETDCPYLAPQSKRGKRNEPAFILETAEKLAEIKNLDQNFVLETVYKNTLSVFKI